MIIILIHFNLFAATEEKACMNKHLHSSAVSEHSMATVCALPSSKVMPLFREQSPSLSDCDTHEKDENFFTSFNKEDWTFPVNFSDGVRWNQRTTHTYDSCFMLPDCVSNNLRMSEEKLNLLLDDNFTLQDVTSLSVKPLNSDIKDLITESDGLDISECSSSGNVGALPVAKGSSAMPLGSEKKQGKVKRKGKKVTSKKVTTVVKLENMNTPVVLKVGLQTSKKKKVPNPRSKQKLATSEELSVLEENIKVQRLVKDNAKKAKSSAKTRKGVKKSMKLLKKEEESKHFKEVRQKGREASFNQSLAAYISVCVSNPYV